MTKVLEEGEEEEEEEGDRARTGSKTMIHIVSEGNKYKAALVQVVEWNLIKFKLYMHLK